MPVCKFIVFIFCFSLFSGLLSAQSNVDSAANNPDTLIIRQPDNAAIEKFLNDPDFAYDRKIQPEMDVWDEILEWLYKNVMNSLINIFGWTFLEIIMYVLFGLLIVYAILKMFGKDVIWLFRRSGDDLPEVNLMETKEQLESMDFNTLIEEALKTGELRKAVRLIYFQILREFSAKEIIDWKVEKTNYEYLKEISRKKDNVFVSAFSDITRIFEFVWYGNFEPDRETVAFMRRKSSELIRKEK